MNVAEHTQRTRNRVASAFSSRRSPGAGFSETQKSLGNINLPNRVPPNTRIDAGVSVTNDSTVVSPFDPDMCEPPGNINPVIDGHDLRVTLLIDGTPVDSDTNCIPGLGATQRMSLTWVTPGSEGEVQARYELTGAASGDLYDEFETTVTISEEAPDQDGSCQVDDDCPSGVPCVDGTCGIQRGGGIFGAFAALQLLINNLPLIVAAVILIMLLSLIR